MDSINIKWQARGSIHAHGCAKLSINPAFSSLAETAAQGWKLELILRLHEHPSYHQMANEVQPQILVGHQALAIVIAYADWLVTTMNDALPTRELGRSLTIPFSNSTSKG